VILSEVNFRSSSKVQFLGGLNVACIKELKCAISAPCK
jgi:hypothetical protein